MKLETMRKLFTLINHPRSAGRINVTYPRKQIDDVLEILKNEILQEIEKQPSITEINKELK